MLVVEKNVIILIKFFGRKMSEIKPALHCTYSLLLSADRMNENNENLSVELVQS